LNYTKNLKVTPTNTKNSAITKINIQYLFNYILILTQINKENNEANVLKYK